MDCKRPDKYRAVSRIVACVLCVMAMASCSWVKDDTDDCPYGFWLRLHYTYNILDVEAATEYVSDAHVYVYDADGNYVKRIYATRDMLLADGHRVRVEGLPEGDYQFVVWSGMGNSQYAVAGDTEAIDRFRLSLSDAEADAPGQQLPPLYHGFLSTVHYDDSYAEHDVQLMKDTNQMACLVVPVTDSSEVKPEEYTMKLMAANSTMDAWNNTVATTTTTYMPFEQEQVDFDDPDYGRLHGARYNLMTMRLMEKGDCRIVLEKRATGEQLFSISVPEYIGMVGTLYTSIGRELTVQEYLDRQDFYTIVFYLSGDLDQLLQLRVNSWRLRAQNHLKL